MLSAGKAHRQVKTAGGLTNHKVDEHADAADDKGVSTAEVLDDVETAEGAAEVDGAEDQAGDEGVGEADGFEDGRAVVD